MRHPVAALALLGLVVACGDDDGPTEPVGAPLTVDEALALVGIAVGNSLELAEDPEQVTGDGTSAVVQYTIPCSMGGTVAVSGEASVTGDDPLSGAFGVSMALTLVHSDCVERDDERGIVFTLNGAPSVVTDIELSITSELGFDFNAALDGTVRWAVGEDRSGSCLIDLNITSDITAGTMTVAGQACGLQISETEALGL